MPRGQCTHWFDLGSVQFSSVEHDGMDGITCASSLDGGGEHIQKVLRTRLTAIHQNQ